MHENEAGGRFVNAQSCTPLSSANWQLEPHHMRYRDGQDVLSGDIVSIDKQYRGTVVGCIDTAKYTPPHSHAQWGYLGAGLMVDTDFGGLVHYPDGPDSDDIVLLCRGA